MTRPLAAVLALVVAGSTATGCAAGGRRAAPALPGCADLLLVGARGSGEDAPLGTTLGDLHQRLTTRHPTLHVAAYGLPYAARTTSADTVADAGTRLAGLVGQRRRQCPDEKLVLAGFSLGAEILGDALQKPNLAPFDAATVLADPRFNPADTATAAGSFDPRYRGDRPRPPYPPERADSIRSYCRARDPICQFGDPTGDKAEHSHYPPEQTCQALRFIEQRTGLPRDACA